MAFEDSMIESGFSDENDYLDYLLDKFDYEESQKDIWRDYNSRLKKDPYNISDYLELIKENPILEEFQEAFKASYKFYKIPNCFPELYPEVEFFAKIKSPDGLKYGYCDNHGNIIIPCIYDYSSLVKEGIAIVKKDESYFCINIKGEQITPALEKKPQWQAKLCCYKELGKNKDVTDIVIYSNCESNSKYSSSHLLINHQGLLIRAKNHYGYFRSWDSLPHKYNYAFCSYNQGLIPVRFNGKWGFLNRNLKEIIPCEYDNFVEYNLSDPANEIHRILIDRVVYPSFIVPQDIYKCISKRTTKINTKPTLPVYCYVLKKGDKWGVLDEKGHILVSFKNKSCSYETFISILIHPPFQPYIEF